MLWKPRRLSHNIQAHVAKRGQSRIQGDAIRATIMTDMHHMAYRIHDRSGLGKERRFTSCRYVITRSLQFPVCFSLRIAGFTLSIANHICFFDFKLLWIVILHFIHGLMLSPSTLQLPGWPHSIRKFHTPGTSPSCRNLRLHQRGAYVGDLMVKLCNSVPLRRHLTLYQPLRYSSLR
jgi:hypothetical protein